MRPASAILACVLLAPFSVAPLAAALEPAPCASVAPGAMLCDSDRDGLLDEARADASASGVLVHLHANATRHGWFESFSVYAPRQGAAYAEWSRVPGAWGNNSTLRAGGFTYSSSPVGVNGAEVEQACFAQPRGWGECDASRTHAGVASSRVGASQASTVVRTPEDASLCTFGVVQRGCEAPGEGAPTLP